MKKSADLIKEEKDCQIYQPNCDEFLKISPQAQFQKFQDFYKLLD